jgi:D-alanyl-lipoteichoic acid acyltransferase DltB (MBOAT superfamily)
VGISFYTFQSVAFAVDVYFRRIRATPDFPLFASFICFFPQLVAGPIERGRQLLTQLEAVHVFDWANVHAGLRLVLVGYFKKIFVANNCALIANYTFDTGGPSSGPWALLGVVAFAFQIYGDFSGYTDIARGSALLFGIRLDHNFAFPYLARSPSEFWARWHITLSTWFRDYLYIPLGGNRHGTLRTLRNLYVTMLLAGLWHGATWMFVLWGAYHGTLLALYRVLPPLHRLEHARGALRYLSVPVMLAFTLLGWLIFRSNDWTAFVRVLGAFGTWPAPEPEWTSSARWVLVHIVPLLVLQFVTRARLDEAALELRAWWARGLDYAVMFLLVASSAVIDVEFIYFQF